MCLVSSKKLLKKFLVGKVNKGGRDNKGHICVKGRGSGHKQRYRVVNFSRSSFVVEGIVENILYDPNRNSHIALIIFSNKVCSLILSSQGLKKGDIIKFGGESLSCSKFLSNFFKNDLIHMLNFKPNGLGKLCRSAGCGALKLANYGSYSLLKLPSGELRLFDSKCVGSLGLVSHVEFSTKNLLKAGDSRHLGKRPKVRGVAMNPVDHPHGGGEGKTSGGRPSVTRFGKVAKGKPTSKRVPFEVVRRSRDSSNSSLIKLKKFSIN